MSRGFVQIRRGLEQHLIAGSIGLFEVGAYLVMHLQADFETGIWTGSAPRLQATAPRGASLRDVQRAIERLSQIKFVRAFHVQGQRGNYRVLIHKYEPQFGALRGKRLNAFASESWRNPVYEVCAEAVTETVAEGDAETVAEDAPYPYKETNQDSKPNGDLSAQAKHRPSLSIFSGVHLQVTPRQDVLLASAFPWVDRQAEYAKADSWLEANPERRPKKKSKFVHNWFSRITPREAKETGSRANARTEKNLRSSGLLQ